MLSFRREARSASYAGGVLTLAGIRVLLWISFVLGCYAGADPRVYGMSPCISLRSLTRARAIQLFSTPQLHGWGEFQEIFPNEWAPTWPGNVHSPGALTILQT